MKALLLGSIGTLAETSSLQCRAYNESFAENGLDWHWSEDEYRELLNTPGGMNRLTRYRDRHDPDVGDEVLQAVHTGKRQHYHAMLEQGEATLRPGVRRIVLAAREAGVRVGLVTTTDRSNIERILASVDAALGIDDFDIVTDRSRVEDEKPNPEAYRIALAELECRPADAVAVEDTAECVSAAVAAGIVCLATPHAFSRDQDFAEAAAVVDSLGDRDDPATVLDGSIRTENGIVTLAALETLRESGHANVA